MECFKDPHSERASHPYLNLLHLQRTRQSFIYQMVEGKQCERMEMGLGKPRRMCVIVIVKWLSKHMTEGCDGFGSMLKINEIFRIFLFQK